MRSLGSYIKETTLTLNIPDSLRFRDGDEQRLVFTMDIKSLYRVIPNDGGLCAQQYYLDKREMLEPSTDTLLRLAELVLTLNTFELNGEFYKQTGGVAMGSRLGPNYAFLFVAYVEERVLSSYTGIRPELYERYMDDVLHVMKKTSVSSLNLLPRSTLTLNIHYLFQGQTSVPGYLQDASS